MLTIITLSATPDHSPPNDRDTTSRAKLPTKKRRTEGPDETITPEIQPYLSGSAKGKGRAPPVEEDMDVDESDRDVRSTSNRNEDEQGTQRTVKKNVANTVYPFPTSSHNI